MERNKVALERERQQQQQQEREQCNAEQAVSKHFEESLRRAKEKVKISFYLFLTNYRTNLKKINGSFRFIHG